ncbi:MAG TPA: ParB/RepB/Spo0J family partition protein [Candidatus Angelobacter sp.]|jgi:ParB family chromosome partitioning protein|nr:ParB/RepB/Spo0J family partition protein [Candidatus Angelobacter sp.]
MNDKRKALGRGLDSLLPGRSSAPHAASSAAPNEIPVDLIHPNPFQTRKNINQETLKELAESIRISGVVQPVVVRPIASGRYQLVAGERRWLASKSAGRTTIPAIVREIQDAQAMEITIIENLQREDLNPLEQARAFERLSRDFGMTQEQIAQRTGKDRASIANFIRLLKLPNDVQEHLEKGTLSFGHGKVLCALTGFPAELARVTQDVVSKSLSVRQTEELVAQILNPENNHGQKKNKSHRPLDPNVREAARNLERSLGVKVEIRDRKGRGKIILRYASLEDFDRIVEFLTVRGK